MQIHVTFRPSSPSTTVDLTDYGHLPETRWEELSEAEQHEIEDNLRENNILYLTVKTIEE